MGLELNIINIYLTSWLQGHLVSIHTEAENQFIYNSFHSGVERSFWIGAIKINSIWTWSDGTPWGDYEKWGPGGPSGDGDCVEMYIDDTSNTESTWNDLTCANFLDLPFVCQITTTSDCEEQ